MRSRPPRRRCSTCAGRSAPPPTREPARSVAVAGAPHDPVAIDDEAVAAIVRASENAHARARDAARRAPSPTGSSAFTTAQSSAVWFAKMRAFAAAYASTSDADRGGRRRKLSHTAIHGRNVVGRLELKAAGLDDVHACRGRLLHLRAQRHADVSAHQHRLPPRPQHSSDQRRRRRLPFRAGDRDHAPAHPPRRELELADDLDAAPRAPLERPAARAARQGSRRSDPPPRSVVGAVAAELQLHARLPQAIRLVERRRAFRSASRAHPVAPSSSAAAMPLRAAPTTTTRRPRTENPVRSTPSPQLQRRQAEQRKDDRR